MKRSPVATGHEQRLHLAAAVGVRYVIENVLRSLQINIRGTEVVLEAANRWKRKVLVFSSSEVYGRTNCGPFTETHDRVFGPVTVSRWTYAAGKEKARRLTAWFGCSPLGRRPSA